MEIEKIGKVYGLTQSTSMITGAVLIWFHAFTGNDYASSIFKRGKQGCFKAMKQCEEFINAFRLLGEDWVLKAELVVALESFVCYLHGYKDTDIKKVRKKMFDKKFVKGEKVIDLSLLPPCQSTLYLLILHSNYVARIWKCSLINVVEYPGIMENGWMENGEIFWVDDALPYNIMDILVDEDFDEGSMELELDPQDDSDDENTDD